MYTLLGDSADVPDGLDTGKNVPETPVPISVVVPSHQPTPNWPVLVLAVRDTFPDAIDVRRMYPGGLEGQICWGSMMTAIPLIDWMPVWLTENDTPCGLPILNDDRGDPGTDI